MRNRQPRRQIFAMGAESILAPTLRETIADRAGIRYVIDSSGARNNHRLPLIRNLATSKTISQVASVSAKTCRRVEPNICIHLFWALGNKTGGGGYMEHG
jgi:hypothetical protein